MKTSDVELPGRPSNSVREVENQDGAVLLDIEQGLCFSINPVGAKIWHMVKQGKSLDHIIDSLATEFNVPKEQVRGDVMEFAAVLNQKGLLLSEARPSTRRLGLLRNVIHRLMSICVLC